MTGDSSKIIDFLRARYDEAERLARSAAPGSWEYQDIDSVGGGRVCDPDVEIANVSWDNTPVDPRIRRSRSAAEADGTGAHIAGHHPAYVLADLDSKRAILGICEADLRQRGDDAMGGLVDRPAWDVVAALAAPFAAHPDYQESWKL